jgi:3-deoxy-7-phosphoheptulonate synthase
VNYRAADVDAACLAALKAGIRPAVMIDASHANSSKKPENQPLVVADVAAQIAACDNRIVGMMIESNLVAGRQDLVPGKPLTYGQSITDGCIGWDATEEVLDVLADAVAERRTLSHRASERHRERAEAEALHTNL